MAVPKNSKVNSTVEEHAKNGLYVGGCQSVLTRWLGGERDGQQFKGHRTAWVDISEKDLVMMVVAVRKGEAGGILEKSLILHCISMYSSASGSLPVCYNKAPDNRGLSKTAVNFLYIVCF